jgi:hypothetical protein
MGQRASTERLLANDDLDFYLVRYTHKNTRPQPLSAAGWRRLQAPYLSEHGAD